jgi:serine/threonine-protein kinase
MDAALRSSVPTPGTLVAGRYRVGTMIGEGGMGVVLAAIDEKEQRDVALKVLQLTGEQNIERFLREARLSMKIASDHVVRVWEVGAMGHMPFFVMERLNGEDFGIKVREGPLDLVDVADCIVQTCEALAHAHGAGIVHRDVKASNLFEHILPNGDKIVKVLDFGISKSFDTGPNNVERTLTRTRDGGFLGSPPYMSPEHVKDPRNVDARSDIWSLGVVAYRLLSTQFPFPGETTGEVLAAILEGKPRRLRQLLVEVPESLDHIILERCLARDREKRFPNIGELARAFAPYASAKFRGYETRVPEICARTPHIIPPERSSRKKMIEPRTATVPPMVEEDPATLWIDQTGPRVPIPYYDPNDQTGPKMKFEVSEGTGPRMPVIARAVPSPLEVLSAAPLPMLRAPESERKPRSSSVTIAILLVLLMGACGGIAYFLTHRPPPQTVVVEAPAPAPAPAPAATTAPVTSTEPTSSVVELAPPAPAISGKRPKGGRFPPPPRPNPSPAPATTKKANPLEPNPYGVPAGGSPTRE